MLGRGGFGRGRRRGGGEFSEDAPGEVLVDFVVPWNGLANLGDGLLIPVVFATVPDEGGSSLFDFLDKVAPLQAATSSAWRRTQGTAPPTRSR